jgi:hypothetical protein
MAFGILTTVKMSMLLFCVIPSRGLVGRYQRLVKCTTKSSGFKTEEIFLRNFGAEVRNALESRGPTTTLETMFYETRSKEG